MGSPKILIFGESGGASRLNADEVSSQCDLATERAITGSLRVHTTTIPQHHHYLSNFHILSVSKNIHDVFTVSVLSFLSVLSVEANRQTDNTDKLLIYVLL